MKKLMFAAVLCLAAVRASTAAQPETPAPGGLFNASFSGKVIESMKSGGYTYVLVDTGKEKKWTATFEFEVRTGDVVHVQNAYEMTGFSSPTLNRTFDHIFFASGMTLGTGSVNVVHGIPPGHHGTESEEPPAAPVAGISGKVIETMNAGGYTYVRVKSSNETIWAATTRFEVKNGDRVTVPRGEIMKNFSSPSLHRTFDSIYFVGFITPEGGKTAGPAANPHGAAAGAAPAALKAPIAQPRGGTSIADLHAKRKQLAGKEVLVKGQVTKVTLEIMDRNWVHIADGTGKPGENDLTITTADTAAVGELITVRGRVALDQDFGYGYAYPLLIEKASLTK